MEVQLTKDQEAFVRQGIESGRYLRAEDAIQEALLLWEEKERRRAEIILALDESEASFARGEGRFIRTREESVQLANEIKARGLARLAAHENL